MAGQQSGEGRVMIDSVVWTQYINVTDSHVAIPNAALTHCVGRHNRATGTLPYNSQYKIPNTDTNMVGCRMRKGEK